MDVQKLERVWKRMQTAGQAPGPCSSGGRYPGGTAAVHHWGKTGLGGSVPAEPPVQGTGPYGPDPRPGGKGPGPAPAAERVFSPRRRCFPARRGQKQGGRGLDHSAKAPSGRTAAGRGVPPGGGGRRRYTAAGPFTAGWRNGRRPWPENSCGCWRELWELDALPAGRARTPVGRKSKRARRVKLSALSVRLRPRRHR